MANEDIEKKNRKKNSILLFGSVILLLTGAHFTVTSATSLSEYLNISPVIVGMFVVGLGTTIQELLFSLRAVQKDDDSLAVGDIFGTVLADATIVLGILAIVKPFHFLFLIFTFVWVYVYRNYVQFVNTKTRSF